MSFELKSEFGDVSKINLNNIIIKTNSMPTANANNLGKVYMYVGQTNENFTHGYIYECVLNGSTYSYNRIDVQPIYEGIESEVIQEIQQDNSVINIALNNDIKNYKVTPTADGEVSITESSKIVDGKLSYFYLFVDMRSGTFNLTWANNIVWGNTSPTMTAMVMYMFSFQTIDGGKTWVGNQMFSWLPNE